MNIFKTYFYSLRKSLISPDYYQDVVKASFSFSLKFFFFSCFLLALVLGTIYSVNASKALNKFIFELRNLPEFYPENLVIEIKDGRVQTNQPEPYFIPLPEFPTQDQTIASPLTNLLVIDTQGKIEDINKYQTIALLTEENIVFRQSENTQEIRVYSLDQIKKFTLNEAFIKSSWQKISGYFKYFVPLATSFIFLGLFISIPLSKFIHLLIFSLITLLFAKILKTTLSYKKSLQINLHAFIVPTLAQEIFKIVSLQIPIPFFYSLVLLIFNLVILASLKEKRTA